MSELGVAKTRLPLASLVMLRMLAGAFIGLGALFKVIVLVALVYHVIYVRPRAREESP